MDELTQLAGLIRSRNSLEREITALIGRPAQIGHIGEYIASRVFHIVLEESASHEGIDGRFSDGPLKNHTVNIKWYALREGVLDIAPNALPDYYLVLTGPKSAAMTSRGQVRPWVIESVFLFEARTLVEELKCRGVRIGEASSVREAAWAKAEVYPAQGNAALVLSEAQRAALALFSSVAGG